MSLLNVDKVDPNTGTTLEIGSSGDTITVPVGAVTSLDGAVTINDSSNDVDFRVESNGDANALFVQGEYGFVGLGQGTPRKMLHITEPSSDCVMILDTNGTTTDNQVCFATNYGTGGETGGNYWAVGVDGSENELNIAFDANSQASVGGADSLLTIDSAGDVTVSSGNLVMGTSGKGIDFSATAGAGTSELFEDYEEGTWTPGHVNVSNTSQEGRYTKIGRCVYYSGYWTMESTANTENLVVSGLPFTIGDNESSRGGAYICYSTAGSAAFYDNDGGGGSLGQWLGVYGLGGKDSTLLYWYGADGNSTVDNNQWSTKQMYFSGFYFTS